MLLQVHSPEHLTASQLDAYLEQGWFRMGQTIFTTNFIRNDAEIRSTIWLRLILDNFNAEAQARLYRRNAAFRVVVSLSEITPEKEELFSLYKQNISFEGSDSLQQLMFGLAERSVFATYEVDLYDGDKLVACGFFDQGATSAEGITSFYDPAYRKYSLGKYLIHLKIKYCKALGLKYFYPGYFVPGNPHFDYKLAIGREALQYLNLSSKSWEPIDSYSRDAIPVDLMNQKLLQVQQILSKNKKASRILKYSFFDANFIREMRDTGLLDFPLFLSLGTDDEINPVLVYDVRDNKYHLISCVPVWRPLTLITIEGFYSTFYLMPIGEIHVAESAVEMAGILLTNAG